MERALIVNLAQGGTEAAFVGSRGRMGFRDEGKLAVRPRESHHRLGDEGIFDGVERFESLRVDGALLVDVLPGKPMQGLSDESKVLDVVAEKVAESNESPHLPLVGGRGHFT